MSVVVADTSPINYLIQTGYMEVLPQLYGRIILPDSVYGELLHQGSPDAVLQWARSLPEWISVQRPSAHLKQLRFSRLHQGEVDAIALAEELKATLILMDDAEAVRVALARGLTITGTLGVLVEAAQHGWVEIEVALERLKSTDFRATESLYQRARQLASVKPPVPPRRQR